MDTSNVGLRIGVLLAHGHLVEERILSGDEVSVGWGAKASVILPAVDGVPRLVSLFAKDGDGWTLRLPAGLRGRVATGDAGEPLDVEALAAALARRHQPARLHLGAGARGKLFLGEVTLLFQTVAQSARVARPRLPASLRSPLRAGLDWMLIAIVGASIVAHTAFVYYLHALPTVPHPDFIDPLAVRSARQVWMRLPAPPRPHTTPTPPTAIARPAPHEHPHVAPRPTHAPEDPRIAARREIRMILLPGGPGGDGETIVDRLVAGRPGSDADRDLAGLGTTVTASRDPVRRGEGGGVHVDGGPLHPVSGPGPVRVGDRDGDKTPPVVIDLPPPSEPVETACNGDAVTRSLAAHRGSLVSCYEHELKLNPSLSVHRAELALEILASGRVANASVAEPSGDEALDRCIATQAAKWHFPPLTCARVDLRAPVIFQTSN